MRFFLRRPAADAKSADSNSAGITTLELSSPDRDSHPQESSPAREPGPSLPDNSPLQDAAPHPAAFAPVQTLVPSSELPSAAAALEQLFADVPTPAPAAPVNPALAPAFLAAVSPAPASPAIELKIADQDQPVDILAEQARTSAAQLAHQSTSAEAPAPQRPPDSGELCPEDAATVLAAASEEIKADDASAAPPNGSSPSSDPAVKAASQSRLASPSTNWRLEEILAAHREWFESKGARGKKADFANAELSGLELINVNLRLADLHYADLKGADLLLADLRDSCMVRADLEEACLVGANLEGANLEGASLETALGIIPRQIAGANLREASLPAQIAQFPALAIFQDASAAAVRFFNMILTLCALSALAIWKTKDIQLVTDSAILPFLHSHRAAVALPTAELFLITPVALFLLYLAFAHQLQRAWGAALELPAVFPNGASLGEKEPAIIAGLLRAHFRWMNQDASSSRALETGICLLLAYWTVPIMLLLFWARYLTLQEIHGTVLHEILAAVAAGVALHAGFRVGRPQEKWVVRKPLITRLGEALRRSRPPVVVAVLLVILTFFSFGTIFGVPHSLSRAPQYGPANIRRWAPTAFWAIGYDPYADLTEAQLSTPPAHWNWADETVSSVRGIRLNDPRFRYAQAYGAFFADSHLWHADFRGAYLSNADFRSADLTQSNFQFALMDSARMSRANLDRSQFQSAHLARADFRGANLSYASLIGSFTMDARFDQAGLYDALLSNSTLIRATFQRADLRNSHIDAANLEHADLRDAYLWSATLQNSDLKDADFGSAILIGATLQGSNLTGAHFAQAVLTETDLSGTILDGADFHGAFGLTASQICAARSRNNASFDDSLSSQLTSLCPAP